MSIKYMDRVMDLGPEVHGANRMVLLVLADRATSDGEAWASEETIARRAGLSSEHVVRKRLRWLEANGYIETVTQGAVHSKLPTIKPPNLYRILLGDPGVHRSGT